MIRKLKKKRNKKPPQTSFRKGIINGICKALAMRKLTVLSYKPSENGKHLNTQLLLKSIMAHN